MKSDVYKAIDDLLIYLKNHGGEGSIHDMRNPRSAVGSNAITLLKKYQLIHYRSHDEWASIIDLTLQGDECIIAGGIENYISKLESKSFNAMTTTKSDLKYNIYINGHNGEINFFDVGETVVYKIVNAYKNGLSKVIVNHIAYQYDHIYEISILTNEKKWTKEQLENYAEEFRSSFTFSDHPPLNTELLMQFGIDVTESFLEDEEFGYAKGKKSDAVEVQKSDYVNKNRIKELSDIKSTTYDLSKLIQICNELNSNWQNESYYTVGLLIRTIINHVPPIFDINFTSFDQVIGQYGSKSFKGSMAALNQSLRNIADNYTHSLIRKKEPLPNEQQVNYGSNLDVLLVEIVSLLH